MEKNGFTLVELLAVIVILAVVILIAVTAVIPRMNNAKKSAFLDEALIYLKAGKEAYISDGTTECYSIDDLGNYVKNNKSGYSGTVFVSAGRVSINLTNGKYYIKGNGLRNLVQGDVVETEPDDFIPTCSDTSNTYNITYNLDGGTIGTANPSTYNSNTSTFTLNNPTKSGYRFIGWSGGKNLRENQVANETSTTKFTHVFWIEADLNPSTTYTVSFYGRVGNSLYTNEKLFNYKTIDIVEGRNSVFATTKDTLDRTDINQYNTTNSGWSIFKNLKVEDSPNYFEDVMIEEGNVATEYEPYLENNTSVVIPRGSSGNRVYTANWEAV